MQFRHAAFCVLTIAALALSGCPNPNAIGVQIYGQVNVHVQDVNGQAVGNALVAIGSNAQSTDGSGNTSFPQIPVGTWTVTADAPGLHGTTQVSVQQNQTASVIVVVNPT